MMMTTTLDQWSLGKLILTLLHHGDPFKWKDVVRVYRLNKTDISKDLGGVSLFTQLSLRSCTILQYGLEKKKNQPQPCFSHLHTILQVISTIIGRDVVLDYTKDPSIF